MLINRCFVGGIAKTKRKFFSSAVSVLRTAQYELYPGRPDQSNTISTSL